MILFSINIKSKQKNLDSFAKIRKYYKDYVADRIKLFDKYVNLYEKISDIERDCYYYILYADEFFHIIVYINNILISIETLFRFESLTN